MDDIDDILADITAAALPTSTSDLHALTRTWVAERCAPELLPYPADLLDRTLVRLAQQIEKVEAASDGVGDARTGFKVVVLQSELERWKFLVRSLLRARLKKDEQKLTSQIDAHPLFYRADPQASNLSSSESQYLNAHQALLSQHYHASFLGQFPPQLQALDDRAGGISMVDEPDRDRAVFVRALRDVLETVYVEGTDVKVDIGRGDVWVIRWSAVRELVLAGDLELI